MLDNNLMLEEIMKDRQRSINQQTEEARLLRELELPGRPGRAGLRNTWLRRLIRQVRMLI